MENKLALKKEAGLSLRIEGVLYSWCTRRVQGGSSAEEEGVGEERRSASQTNSNWQNLRNLLDKKGGKKAKERSLKNGKVM